MADTPSRKPKMTGTQGDVLRWLKRIGCGATVDNISRATGHGHEAVKGALRRLFHRGLVLRGNLRINNLWIATPEEVLKDPPDENPEPPPLPPLPAHFPPLRGILPRA